MVLAWARIASASTCRSSGFWEPGDAIDQARRDAVQRFRESRSHGCDSPLGLCRRVAEFVSSEGPANFFENMVAAGNAEERRLVRGAEERVAERHGNQNTCIQHHAILIVGGQDHSDLSCKDPPQTPVKRGRRVLFSFPRPGCFCRRAHRGRRACDGCLPCGAGPFSFQSLE